jgi:hypothetical protein
MIFTGLCMLFTNLTYWLLLPYEPLIAHIEGSILIFHFGWNYWLVLVAGEFRILLTKNLLNKSYACNYIIILFLTNLIVLKFSREKFI